MKTSKSSIKLEQDKWKLSFCSACLSQNRNLYNLGQFREIYRILCRSVNLVLNCDATLCWECMKLLRNVREFQEKLQNSFFVLKELCGNEQGTPPKSLSNLAKSEILTLDTFENVENETLKTEEDLEETFEEGTELPKEEECTEVTTLCKDESKINEIQNCPKGNVIENNEDVPKSLHMKDVDYDLKNGCRTEDRPNRNSYPKERKKRYEMTYQSLKWNDAVTRIQINNSQINIWLDNERNSDHYRSLKNKCNICLQKLKMDEKIYVHIQKRHTVTNSHPYTCDVCKLQFNSKRHLSAHINKHSYIQHCNICLYECYSTLHMKYHLIKSHKRNVTCLECGESFGSTRQFYSHLRSHPATHCYLCDQCDKKTRTLQLLERHIQRNHTPQRCEECDTTFRSYKLLVRHNKHKHTYNPTEECYCAPCDKQFGNQSAYRRHLLQAVTHMRERGVRARRKEVPCPVCHKVYSKNETMMNHYRWQHSKDSKYKCESCDLQFLNRTKFKEHMLHKHLGVKKPKDKICRYCNKGFTTNQSLGYHILTHTGDRPHSCPVCSQRFRQRSTMTSHIKNVHSEEMRIENYS